MAQAGRGGQRPGEDGAMTNSQSAGPILVVKFGGSFAGSAGLLRWIEAIERSAMPVVVVPGGGPFADAVRRCQPRIGYDDAAAHHMAILAMEQYGVALVSLGSRLAPASTLEEMDRVMAEGQVPIWMPKEMVLADPAVERNWSVTSDSLAAWLAGRFEGSNLLLLKQIDLPENSTVEAICRAGIIDGAFEAQLASATPVYVSGPADLASAGRRLAIGEIPGRRVVSGPGAMAQAAQ